MDFSTWLLIFPKNPVNLESVTSTSSSFLVGRVVFRQFWAAKNREEVHLVLEKRMGNCFWDGFEVDFHNTSPAKARSLVFKFVFSFTFVPKSWWTFHVEELFEELHLQSYASQAAGNRPCEAMTKNHHNRHIKISLNRYIMWLEFTIGHLSNEY